MQTYDVEITYLYDGDTYLAEPMQIQAKDEQAAEDIARSIFISQKNVFDEIKEVDVHEIPLGI